MFDGFCKSELNQLIKKVENKEKGSVWSNIKCEHFPKTEFFWRIWTYRNKVSTANFVPWPIEIRFCVPDKATNNTKSPPSLRYWFRAKGELSDDQALHRCVAAYTSDLIFLTVSLNPHWKMSFETSAVSLDHSMWFHRPLRADDWILFVINSSTAYNARGFVWGQIFNRKGELVVSITQEGLLRPARKLPAFRPML